MTPEQASIIAEFLLPQIEQEVQTTAKVLAAVPEDQKDYTPESKCNTKCMTAGELVHHIAGSDLWFLEGIANGKFAEDQAPSTGSIAEVAANYQARAAELLGKIKQLPADHLAMDVQFFTWNLPNATYLQFMQKHSIHHRGQLTAYLRPMGSKVPSIYGGSADEPFTAAAGESA
jgi:uncharacterized damage-inducible protein DinB